jgi:hypothetical protein
VPDNPSKSGLHDDQMSELLRLKVKYLASMGHDISRRDAFFGYLLTQYLSCLAVDAIFENQLLKKNAMRTANRQKTMQRFESHFGRRTTPEDFLAELSKVGKVPAWIVNAIHRDHEEQIERT